MTSTARLALMALVALAIVPAAASAACDAGGTDAPAIAAARAVIDATCPCAAATGRAAYRSCANQVVRARVLAALLAPGCRRDTLRHAKLSICGRPGSAVCCRVRADGRTRHRVVSDAADCVDTPTLATCVSSWQSVPTGCDAGGGCVAPAVCGDGAVNAAGEECDPPDRLFCDLACHAITCDPPASLCGNGTIDAGEACEPPGVGDCARTCQLAACPAPAAGHVAIACVPNAGFAMGGGATSFAATGSPTGYLIAWSGAHDREAFDLMVRRYDPDVVAVDPGVTVVSGDAPCAAQHGSPSIGFDGSQYYVAWSSFGFLSDGGPGFQAITGRRVGGTSGMQPIDDLAYNLPVGFCRTGIGGPTIAAGVFADRFAVGHLQVYSCPQGFIRIPVGRILDFAPGAVVPSVTLGAPIDPPPAAFAASGATVATLGDDVLWAWHSIDTATFSDETIAAVWTDATSSTPAASLTSRGAYVETAPAAAAGAASILVAWAQGVTDTANELRAVRVTRAGGNLDADGGVLLATAADRVTGGPVAAYDGTRWLVAWTESTGFQVNALRAVAVADDGTVLDASPRLLASDVRTTLAAASAGDGRVLVVYGQPTGGRTAVRATLVTP